MSARSLSFEDFEPQVGQTFTMRYAGDPGEAAQGCEAVLTECARSAVPGASRSFNLLLRAGPDAPREQGTFLLSRDGFEPAPIFLVPVRALVNGVEFHAVFNPSTEDENVP